MKEFENLTFAEKAAIVIPLFTLAAYLFAFAYETGSAHFYGYPISLIRVSTENVFYAVGMFLSVITSALIIIFLKYITLLGWSKIASIPFIIFGIEIEIVHKLKALSLRILRNRNLNALLSLFLPLPILFLFLYLGKRYSLEFISHIPDPWAGVGRIIQVSIIIFALVLWVRGFLFLDTFDDPHNLKANTLTEKTISHLKKTNQNGNFILHCSYRSLSSTQGYIAHSI